MRQAWTRACCNATKKLLPKGWLFITLFLNEEESWMRLQKVGTSIICAYMRDTFIPRRTFKRV